LARTRSICPKLPPRWTKLVEEGKVRIKGQSAYSADDFERVCPVVKPQVLQSWAHAWTMGLCVPVRA
jgi:hypothetical protein